MKILLINPPVSHYKENFGYARYLPNGVLYLAGYLQDKGVDVDVVDYAGDELSLSGDYIWQGKTLEEVEADLVGRDFDIVGISSMFSIHCYAVHEVARLVKKVRPSASVIIGGTHASSFSDYILKDYNVDYVAVGEGESILSDFLGEYSGAKNWENIKGLAWRNDGGEYVFNGRREGFLDLKTHPGPAWNKINVNDYLNSEYEKKHAMNSRKLAIVTSRGCPCKCIYCSIHSVWNHSYNTRDSQQVLDELTMLVEKYNVGEIAFMDDNLAAHRAHFEAILDGIIERKLPIRWCTPNGVAIWCLDERLIEKCRRAGCYKMTFGIETGCPKTQKFIRKTQINLERASELIRHCHKCGLWTMSPFIIGFPFETRDDILQTVDYALNCGLDIASFFVATPYPGCDMYDIYKENGLLPDNVEDVSPDIWIGNINNSRVNTCELTADELMGLHDYARGRLRKACLKKFTNPLYLMKKVNNLQDLSYIMKFAPIGFKKFILKK